MEDLIKLKSEIAEKLSIISYLGSITLTSDNIEYLNYFSDLLDEFLYELSDTTDNED